MLRLKSDKIEDISEGIRRRDENTFLISRKYLFLALCFFLFFEKGFFYTYEEMGMTIKRKNLLFKLISIGSSFAKLMKRINFVKFSDFALFFILKILL